MSEYNLPELEDAPISNQNEEPLKNTDDTNQNSQKSENPNKEIDKGLFCVKSDILYNWISGKHLISTHVFNSDREKRSLKESNTMNEVLMKMTKFIENEYPEDINPNTELHIKSKFRSPLTFLLVHGNKQQEIFIEFTFDHGFYTGSWQNFSFSSQDFFKFIDIWRVNLLKYFKKKYNKTKLILIKPPEKIYIDYQVAIRND